MKAFLAALFLALSAQSTALGQQRPTPPDTLPNVAGRSGGDTTPATTLEPVSVTARRQQRRYSPSITASALKTPIRSLDVPQSLATVTRQLIRDRSIQSLADVVRFMPGITAAQGEGNRDQLVIRGNSSTADFFIDGVRDDAQFFRDLYNVERLEALKGPNAMIFGRGGGGGLINRVSKEPVWIPVREFVAEGGAYGHARGSADFGYAPTTALATRVSGVLESSGSFRNGVSRRRYGVNPSLKILPAPSTSLRFDFEHFRDRRTADRGIPSFQGRPFETGPSTFFGDPDESFSDARVNAASATLERGRPGIVHLRNHSRLAAYDKFYQNVFPGRMSADGSEVSISAYNNKTTRTNLFNQTDLNATLERGRVVHALLFGAELGRQATENFRATGYFNNSTTSVDAPASAPTISVPLTFRQAAGDADNSVRATVLSAYVQDRISLGSRWTALAGARYETFDIDYRDNRSGTSLGRRDGMLSPRAAIIHKPSDRLSIYGSFSVSYLPSSGDQFAALTDVTQTLKPERFENREIGAKWGVASGLELSAAWYVLDRTNTRALDPVDPKKTVQTGSQRTSGYELEAHGAITNSWDVMAGVSRQRARLRQATTAGPAGAVVPLTPPRTATLWNRYQLTGRFALGGGFTYQSASYASIDNKVTLPSFTEVDAALYYLMTHRLHAQINVDNLLNRRHYHTAHSNNNISPGEPRSLRLSVSTEF